MNHVVNLDKWCRLHKRNKSGCVVRELVTLVVGYTDCNGVPQPNPNDYMAYGQLVRRMEVPTGLDNPVEAFYYSKGGFSGYYLLIEGRTPIRVTANGKTDRVRELTNIWGLHLDGGTLTECNKAMLARVCRIPESRAHLKLPDSVQPLGPCGTHIYSNFPIRARDPQLLLEYPETD